VALDDSNLVVRTLGGSDQILVASPSFIRAHGPFDTIDSFQGKRGVGPGGQAGEPSRWRLSAIDGSSIEISYSTYLVTDDVHLLMAAAIGGTGLAVLPFNVCRDSILNGELVVMLPGYRGATHQLHAVFPSRRGLVPAVRAFIEFLAAEIPQKMLEERQVLQGLFEPQD
jgi:DNA-binding transcriptional LysR family regulator